MVRVKGPLSFFFTPMVLGAFSKFTMIPCIFLHSQNYHGVVCPFYNLPCIYLHLWPLINYFQNFLTKLKRNRHQPGTISMKEKRHRNKTSTKTTSIHFFRKSSPVGLCSGKIPDLLSCDPERASP